MASVILTILALLITFFIISMIFILINRTTKNNMVLRWILTGGFLFWFLYSFLVAPYPNINVDGLMVTSSNPKKSQVIARINKLENLPELGYIYFDRLENVNNKELQLYYRTLGKFSSPWESKQIPVLKDTGGNTYQSIGGAVNSGILLTGGVMEFRAPVSLRKDVSLFINGREILK